MKGVTLNQDPLDTTGVVTGLNNETHALTVYPNPFTSQIILSGFHDAKDQITVRLMNTVGAIVFEETAIVSNTRDLTVDPQLPRGLYVYQISGGTGRLKTGRIFKE